MFSTWGGGEGKGLIEREDLIKGKGLIEREDLIKVEGLSEEGLFMEGC